MSNRPDILVHAPSGELHITLKPDERAMSVTELLRRHNLPLNTRCGQRGLCDSCRITLEQGTIQHRDTGDMISSNGEFQACQYRVCDGPLTLRVSDRAVTAYKPQVLDAFRINVARAHDPLCGDVSSETDAPLGVAVDLGTTTVAVLLVDLTNGEILARVSSFNQQMHFGDDVLTRINLCLNDKTLVHRMQEAIVNDTLAPLIAEALEQAGRDFDDIRCVATAGNTTMLHLFAAVDPTPMGTAPFTPAFTEHTVTSFEEVEFRLPPRKQSPRKSSSSRKRSAKAPSSGGGASGGVHLLPSAAAYVGADLTAGIVASNLLFDVGTAMLVDVGTNGEIILKHEGKLYGCATAAGPAFEGSKLTDGIRAGQGAVAHIRIDPASLGLGYEVIGEPGVFDDHDRPHAPAVGLCGSAYVDFLAQGAASGLLLPTGRYDRDHLADAMLGRFDVADRKCHGPCFRVAYGKGKEPLVISEADIAALLQAKAAIAAGILTLLDKVGLTPADVKTLHLAGGFGMHMRLESAVGSGLLPGFRVDQIELAGNTSLAGAYMALIDRTAIEEMTDAAKRIEIVELNLEPSFQDHYIDQLLLPPPEVAPKTWRSLSEHEA